VEDRASSTCATCALVESLRQRPEETTPVAQNERCKMKQRVLVVADFLLRGTEASVCWPDRQSREVCCLARS